MFVIPAEETGGVPVKVWLDSLDELEDECRRQALNIAALPFAFHHVAIMPDAHAGYGMPIGGILATTDNIVPNAVGVDIGCGVAFVDTKTPVEVVSGPGKRGRSIIQSCVDAILKAIPTGFDHHKKKQPCKVLDEFSIPASLSPAELMAEVDRGYYQVGTLGGGNHFIELQEDEAGHLCLMLHSGSRNFGYKICRHFFTVAKSKLRKKRLSDTNLAYLPVDSKEGQAYIAWMQLAQRFARENREAMLRRVQTVVAEEVQRQMGVEVIYGARVNAHHNYAALESHFGRQVWVHRKGAIRARAGEVGVIPGAMGTASYVVEGLGNPESFMSCSHGAGRRLSRSEAKSRLRPQEVVAQLQQRGIVLGKRKLSDVAEEAMQAYKDIDDVLSKQTDLVRVTRRLQTLGVVKG